MTGVPFVLLCVGFAGLAVLCLRLAYRVVRLENCLLMASECLGDHEHG